MVSTTLPSRRRIDWLPVVTGAVLILLVALGTRAYQVAGSLLALGALGPRSLGTAFGLALAGGAVLATTPLGARWRQLIEESGTATWVDLGRLALIAIQIGLLALAMRAFRIESPAFYEKLVPLIAVVFLGHHFLPRRWRLPGFLGLSLAGGVWVFGLPTAAWLYTLGGTLILLCHLPVAFGIRIALLIAAGALLAASRAGVLPVPWSAALWPVLGSMFMFRLPAYLYDLRHQRTPVSWPRTASYFFLLPNVAFPLFPVVDFNTFSRTHYDRPPLAIYQQGVAWVARGTLHLLVYRLVYQYATLSPADVVDTVSLVRYLLANFGLYLRVSGQFHLIVGLLHLFGFRLPETHRFFFLASSFTDFWRRINIYWKDFMQKVVFTPALFALRRRGAGETTGIVFASLAVFAATWALHSYQWFWLLGTWLWSATDAIFWAVLAVLLVANSLRELRRGRQRSLGGTVRLAPRQLAGLGLRTAATFAVICFLWGLWTSPTSGDFVALLSAATLRPLDVAVIAGTLGTVALLAIAAHRVAPAGAAASARAGTASTLGAGVAMLLLYAAGRPEVAPYLSADLREVARDMRVAELNRRDAAELQRGYYEQIVGVNRFNGQLWEVYARREGREPELRDLGVVMGTSDRRQVTLKPFVGIPYHGGTLRTNRWGMRDRDYDLVRAPSSYRIALLGQSYVLGMGVADGENFESLIEDRLNHEHPLSSIERYEILNFAVPRYSLLQQVALLEADDVFRFTPDAVVLVGHPIDLMRIGDYLRTELMAGRPVDPFLQQRLDQAGVVVGMGLDEVQRRIEPFRSEITRWAFERIVRLCLSRGIQPVYALVSMPLDGELEARTPQALELANAAGFTVIDLSDVYAGHDESRLVVAEWDRHPNAAGHRIIAERLYAPLVARFVAQSQAP